MAICFSSRIAYETMRRKITPFSAKQGDRYNVQIQNICKDCQTQPHLPSKPEEGECNRSHLGEVSSKADSWKHSLMGMECRKCQQKYTPRRNSGSRKEMWTGKPQKTSRKENKNGIARKTTEKEAYGKLDLADDSVTGIEIRIEIRKVAKIECKQSQKGSERKWKRGKSRSIVKPINRAPKEKNLNDGIEYFKI